MSKRKKKKKNAIINKNKICTAYVDGSYNHKTKKGGCGIIFIESGQVIKEISKSLSGPEVIKGTSGVAEVEAAKKAIEIGLPQSHWL